MDLRPPHRTALRCRHAFHRRALIWSHARLSVGILRLSWNSRVSTVPSTPARKPSNRSKRVPTPATHRGVAMRRDRPQAVQTRRDGGCRHRMPGHARRHVRGAASLYGFALNSLERMTGKSRAASPASLDAFRIVVRYLVTTQLTASDIERLGQVLSPDERARSERFAFEKNRRDYVAAHALLRQTLSQCADVTPDKWAFEAEPSGKPRISGGPLSFSLSHTDGCVACVVANRRPVGIDVECQGRAIDPGTADYFLAEEEQAAVGRTTPASSDETGALVLWTLKEAFLKATGDGLTRPPNSFAFRIRDGSVTLVPPPGIDRAAWRFELFRPTAEHCAAVAIAGYSSEPLQIDIQRVSSL